MDSVTTVTPEQLEEATKNYAKALELRDSERETAIELFGKVLEVRNKAFGEKAIECADAYLYYGELLFEQAQDNTDYFGEQVKSAAMQRARHIAAGEDGEGAEDGDGAEQDGEAEVAEDGEMGDADDTEKDPAQPTEGATTTPAEAKPEPPANKEDATEVATAPETASDKPEQPTTDDKAADTTTSDKPADTPVEAAVAEDQEQLEGEDEFDDEESDEGEDAGSEDMAEGQEAPEAPEVTGETDDMALAWEMLEMARLIYNENGGAEKFANKLADCHMYIADILCEQEKFEDAVPEYNTAQQLLSKLEGGLQAHKRRAAELDFKKATALQLSEQLPEALEAIRSAKAHLQARLDEVNVELGKAGAAGSSGAAAAAAGDASGAAAFAAFAAVLTGYSKPAESADKKEESQAASVTSDDAEKAAAVAKKQQEAADLRSLIDNINDRMDELKAAVDEHLSMKEQLRKTFEMVAAEKGSGDDQNEAAAEGGLRAAAAAGMESTGFAAPTMQAGAVQDMGVIGKGKRIAPVPIAAAGSEDKTEKGEAGKKRTLSDLVSSDQEHSNEAAEVAAPGKPSPAVAAEQPDAAPKKARAEA